MNDVIPELVPVSADDIWIQILLIIIILLTFDKLNENGGIKR